jgi:hypothetical protein
LTQAFCYGILNKKEGAMACNKTAVKWLTAFTLSSKRSARTFVDKRDFYSLSYRYKGKIYVEDNGEKLFSKEDSITFIPKGLSYNTVILDEMSMAVIHFKLDSDIDFRAAANHALMRISARPMITPHKGSKGPSDIRYFSFLSMYISDTGCAILIFNICCG